jgi:uncharacterized protein with PIN domain
MIAVDTSALIAIILNEPEREQFLAVLDAAPATVMSASSILSAKPMAAPKPLLSTRSTPD